MLVENCFCGKTFLAAIQNDEVSTEKSGKKKSKKSRRDDDGINFLAYMSLGILLKI